MKLAPLKADKNGSLMRIRDKGEDLRRIIARYVVFEGFKLGYSTHSTKDTSISGYGSNIIITITI